MYQDDAFDWRQRAAMLELQGRDLSDLASALAEHAGYGSNDPFYKISRVLRALGAARERTAHEIWMTGHDTESTVRDEIRSISDEHTDRIVRAVLAAERAAERIEQAIRAGNWTVHPSAQPAYPAIVERGPAFRDARQRRTRRWLTGAALSGVLAVSAWFLFSDATGERSRGIHPADQTEWIALDTRQSEQGHEGKAGERGQ